MPVILATWEVEIRRITVLTGLGKNKTPSLTDSQNSWRCLCLLFYLKDITKDAHEEIHRARHGEETRASLPQVTVWKQKKLETRGSSVTGHWPHGKKRPQSLKPDSSS
jgi:hypothetical protein